MAEELCNMRSSNNMETVFTNRQCYTRPVDELTVVVPTARVKF